MGMVFPISHCIIISVFIFSSVFMKNILLAHKNKRAAAYHSLSDRRGLSRFQTEHLHASWGGRSAKSISSWWTAEAADFHSLLDSVFPSFVLPTFQSHEIV
jgi:hypothetical protein